MSMFKPKKPIEFVKHGQDRLNMGKTSAFVDDVLRTQFQVSGTHCHFFRLEGYYDQERDVFNIKQPTPEESGNIGSFIGVQDPILMENRDRRYNIDEVPVVKGLLTLSENASELLRFGIKSNEVLNVEFHQTEIEEMLGRRIVVGDLVMIPVFRSPSLDGRVANKIYEVKDVDWSTGGYDAHYIPHIVTAVLQPIRDQWEYRDVLENLIDEYGKSAQEQMSNYEELIKVTERVQKKALEHASITGRDDSLIYLEPETGSLTYLWLDDAIPPNGIPVEQGSNFPPDPQEGQYFLHLGLHPARLYRFENGRWRTKEIARKREWLYNFTSMLRTFMSDGSEHDRSRGYELKSIHDIATDRHDGSDPSVLD
ncbi:MAG: hypothetical protein D6698_13785 [Gammaproteobacteria bacterium]|nr:MAG: hypothetical protein D6698_13785 [Gammaproteobacteria bacterium]